MSTKIEAFKKARNELGYAKGWVELIGKPYHGGGGGIGKITSVKVGATVYHQYSNGATNYHEAPDALRAALAEVFIQRQKELIDQAIALLETNSQALGKEAVAEHAQLLKDAGLTAEVSA